MKHIKLPWRKVVLTVATLLFTTAGLNAGLAVGQASASSCRWYNVDKTNETLDPSWQYYDTTVLTVPSWSVCNDINITGTRIDWRQQGDVYDQCAYYHVRFYPSSGGSYTNSWKRVCDTGSHVIAYSVLNGTRYRVEVVPEAGVMGSGGIFNHPAFSLFD
ncbi:MAG TPA: hypothetical protein VKQ34_03305 [Candidatus Saccharimonadales bacterium]|nr:hypothetical protein [Candidatus Saccharimonadales bacterium]